MIIEAIIKLKGLHMQLLRSFQLLFFFHQIW